MPRHYTYPSRAQRDAAVEKRLREAEAARLAGLSAPPPDLRYDCRPCWPIDIDYPGHAVHWDVKPDRRNIRAWVVVDRESGAVVMRGGMDRIAQAAFAGLPRRFLGRRAAEH